MARRIGAAEAVPNILAPEGSSVPCDRLGIRSFGYRTRADRSGRVLMRARANWTHAYPPPMCPVYRRMLVTCARLQALEMQGRLP